MVFFDIEVVLDIVPAPSFFGGLSVANADLFSFILLAFLWLITSHKCLWVEDSISRCPPKFGLKKKKKNSV